MTWTLAGLRGNNNGGTTAGTSLAMTVATANITAGQVCIVCATRNNTSTTDGETDEITSITDSTGGSNTWTKVKEWCESAGAADGGIVGAMYYSLISTGLTSGSSTITANYSSSRAGRTVSCTAFDFAAGSTVQVDYANGEADGSTASPSITSGSVSSVERLWLGLSVREGYNGSGTMDADYVEDWDFGTGGTIATHAGQHFGHRIATITSDTFAPTYGSTNRDTAIILAALLEVPAAGGATHQGWWGKGLGW